MCYSTGAGQGEEQGHKVTMSWWWLIDGLMGMDSWMN